METIIFKEIVERQEKNDVTVGSKDISLFYVRGTVSSFGVLQFLERNSIDFPGKRGASIQRKVLTQPMWVLYKEFKKAHPNVKLSFATFKRRRPQHIVTFSSRKFLQCLCERCTNVMLLMDAINKELEEEQRILTIEDAVGKTLCTDVGRLCVERECADCGVGSVMTDLCEAIDNKTKVKKWSKWEKTEKASKDLVFREDSLSNILTMLQTAVHDVAKHLKVAEWQRRQYTRLKSCLPKGHAMCTVDFSENYLCKFQNEVQSAHWSYRQVSVHPCVFIYRCNQPECYKVVTEYVVFLTDVLKHDSNLTKHILNLCIEKGKELGLAALHIFSDGCSSQYKSRYTFHHLSQLQELHPHIKITRHFFGSNHGKSLCDSCGGVVKNAAIRAVLAGREVIQSAQQMFQYCSKNLTVTGDDSCSHLENLRSFAVIQPTDIPSQTTSVGLHFPAKGMLSIKKLVLFL